MALVCVMAGVCCRAQMIFQQVLVGDSLTTMSLGIRLQDGSIVPHVGVLRRGHACIDWTLKGDLTMPPDAIDLDGQYYAVKAVVFHAFYKCVGLTRVTLPPTVRLMGYEAFVGCSALNEVVLPDSLLLIGERAFSGCTALQRIVVPCAVPPRCPADAFDDATCHVARLVVPQGCRATYLATEPWCRFTQIEEGDAVASPAETVDYDYWERTKEILETVHADELWRIPLRVEGDVTWTVVLPTSSGPQQVTYSTRKVADMAVVGSGMTDTCCIDTTFTGHLALPDSVTAPDGRRYVVGGVASNAFSGCRRLQGVDMPRHLLIIGSYAFSDCEALQQVTLPAAMREVMQEAFAGCKGLYRVETLAQRPPDLFVDAFDDRTFNTATLVVPDGAMEAYMATDAWPLFKYRMENVEF